MQSYTSFNVDLHGSSQETLTYSMTKLVVFEAVWPMMIIKKICLCFFLIPTKIGEGSYFYSALTFVNFADLFRPPY